MKPTEITAEKAGDEIGARLQTLTPLEHHVFARRVQPIPPRWRELSLETGKSKEYLVKVWGEASKKMLTDRN
jgi:hypothetical protein